MKNSSHDVLQNFLCIFKEYGDSSCIGNIMKTLGIITIHKINNYGSVLQAYALQYFCQTLGYHTEILDYNFPNEYHKDNKFVQLNGGAQPNEPRWIKLLFLGALCRQHAKIRTFVAKYLQLSSRVYNSPTELLSDPPAYDVYLTGSDQLWSPKHCNGDPSFFLHFASDESIKISYAASFGTKSIPDDLTSQYSYLLKRYDSISLREISGKDVVRQLVNVEADVVLDPTLLLDKDQWNLVAKPKRLVKDKYILCYYLNYSFNAFPYVDDLAEYIRNETGYRIVRVARPPHSLTSFHASYYIDAGPDEFLALVRDAEIVLTTSFHGTAFAVNYGRPVLSIVEDKNSDDGRQVEFMRSVGLFDQVVALNAPFPKPHEAKYDVSEMYDKLKGLRTHSINFLMKSLSNE